MIVISAADMARVHRAAFATDRPWTEAEFADLLNSPGVQVLGTDEGFILIRVVADEAEVLTIAVHPDAQKKGIGARLVQDSLRHSAAHGAARSFLEVAADNQAAFRLYQRHGYKETARRKGYYPRTDGTPVDAVLMEAEVTKGHNTD